MYENGTRINVQCNCSQMDLSCMDFKLLATTKLFVASAKVHFINALNNNNNNILLQPARERYSCNAHIEKKLHKV